MQFSSRFTMATHVLLCLHTFEGQYKLTSAFLAGSVNVNNVIIRNLLGQLKEAGLVQVKAGVGGASLARPAESITLLDIFKAVEDSAQELFSFHKNPNPACPIGSTIHQRLDGKLKDAQIAVENELRKTTLADLALVQ